VTELTENYFDRAIEIPFEKDEIAAQVADKPGIYEILQDKEYARYIGKTRILKIGISCSSLRRELLNHFKRHTAANRLARILSSGTARVTVVFAMVDEKETAEAEELLLRRFEDAHWDLPVLNSQRGYKRAKDTHFRSSHRF
jgi:hypothetical protein